MDLRLYIEKWSSLPLEHGLGRLRAGNDALVLDNGRPWVNFRKYRWKRRACMLLPGWESRVLPIIQTQRPSILWPVIGDIDSKYEPLTLSLRYQVSEVHLRLFTARDPDGYEEQRRESQLEGFNFGPCHLIYLEILSLKASVKTSYIRSSLLGGGAGVVFLSSNLPASH